MKTGGVDVVLVGLTLCAFVHVQMASDATKGLGNGFGDDIDWVEWPNAVSIALDLDKPIFLLIHKTWCGACTALKKSFETSSKRKELVELSSKFVMTNTEDDDEPEEDVYAPDGRYIPRLFFLNKYGKPLAVDNKKSYANNAHYFPQVPDVIKAMKLALEKYEEQKEKSPDEPVEVPDNESEEKSDDETNEKADKKKSSKETAEKEQKSEEKKTKKDEARVIEKPDEDSLGEIHLSEEELSFMETGGCPHAAAARAAAMQSANSDDRDAEKKEEEKEKKKESSKKEKAADTKKAVKEKKKGEKDETPKAAATKKDDKGKKTEL